MKTAKYFDEYNEYVTGQRENINKLEKERQELTQRIKEDKVKYKELIANSQDDEADKLYTTFDSNEKRLKALEKRLSTKKEVFDEARRKKAIELIKHQADLPHLYQEDKERILAKFEPIIEEFNKVIDEVEDLNARYKDEFMRYTNPYHIENFDEDDEVKRELRNHFRDVLYSPYITSIELPFTDKFKDKLKFRGDK
ncbi:BAR domain-containing protein [Staphylococcus haemolyticus]|uniref:pathogenicity island protein n=1 Tax=Staphylococcus haemolyticus TaxID=1283 RepID=UPI0011AB1D94|nr:pathogenicity island protein [Staphylococcus haemolyticus]MBE7354493.1 pathogenicity island protein [Staphylococcus haemolyticus]MBK3924211.1 pathogenicity island protein [Staphylococcus haemolyticus]MCH4401603.1 pathogenicity island protein [Staphylococcus haemolyticus]MCH4429698.1 pathogenicity island protein [Staphylococcus haemolyticus]MDN7233052.1 pathogenicity island protein [Staphylococcus haemolyticus]